MVNGNNTRDALYNRLPTTYRERDAALGEPLRALLRIIAEQAEIVDADIQQIWDNFFVETSEPWAIPYIGDLVGTTPLFDASHIQQPDTARNLFPDLTGPNFLPEVALRSRADVAKTIYYRRRKGTVPMLEELARDVTGWGAHVVEFFELLIWNQYIRNHLRPTSLGTPDIRRVEPIDRLNGPFDTVGHTVDVRTISQLTGWYNIKNIGFFLWRLRSYEAENVQARRVGAAGDYRYHFSPLGNPAPLFSRWRREGDEAGVAGELHVPGPIRPAAFYEDLQAYLDLSTPRPGYTEFYGLFEVVPGSSLPQAPDSSLVIFRDGVPVPPDKVRCINLSTWRQPHDPTVPVTEIAGVDVSRGRIAFGTGWEPTQGVDVYYHYGFSADLGGGSYQRRAWQIRRTLADLVIQVDGSGTTPGAQTTLNGALTQWANAGKPNTILSILDSRTYSESITLEPADGRWLAIEAADGVRPHLQLTGPLEIVGDHPEASVTLSGLLIEGWVHVTGSLGRLRLLHSTLVPGRGLTDAGQPATSDPSIVADFGPSANPGNLQLRVELAFSITGPLRVPDHAEGIWALDSIVDGLDTSAIAAPSTTDQSGPRAWLERVTILGPSYVKELTMASEVIFTGPVTAERRQEGCVRFSFLPVGSVTPQRYRCQPDLEIANQIEQAEQRAAAEGTTLSQVQRDAITAEINGWLVPSFTSMRYGQPAYCQLLLTCPELIKTGAEDGSEMGAFCHLKQPQREANLRLRLEEYLPFGLEAGIIYVT